jgi:O-antigen/teichoic acid export membrane protein
MIKSIWNVIKSGIFKRTIIYTATASLNALVAFLLLPVLTRYLSPFDYGIIETFMAVVTCLTGAVIIGGNTIMSKEYFVFETTERQIFVGNILGMILIASASLLLVYFLSCLWGNIFSNYLKIKNELVTLAILVSCGNAFISMISNTFQLEKNAKSFMILMNSKSLFEILLSLFLIIGLGLTWDGRITGISISIILFSAVALYLFKQRSINIKMPIRYGRQILLLGLPLVLSHLGGWVYGMVDRIMINNLVGADAAGLYSVGYRFGMVVMMVETSFSLAWLPFFYENIALKRRENNLKIVKSTYIYITFLIFFGVSFGYFAKYLVYFMVDERFFGAAQFVFIISVAYCFAGIWKMFLGYIIFTGRMKTYSAITIGCAVIQVVLNYIMINTFGPIGAAWATCISMAVGAMLTIIVANMIYKMPWNLQLQKYL